MAVRVVFCCCCILSVSRLHMLWAQRCSSTITIRVTFAFLSAQSTVAILLWLPASMRDFLFFKLYSLNPRDASSRSAGSEILAHLVPTTIPHLKSFKSPFFIILMLGLNFSCCYPLTNNCMIPLEQQHLFRPITVSGGLRFKNKKTL